MALQSTGLRRLFIKQKTDREGRFFGYGEKLMPLKNSRFFVFLKENAVFHYFRDKDNY